MDKFKLKSGEQTNENYEFIVENPNKYMVFIWNHYTYDTIYPYLTTIYSQLYQFFDKWASMDYSNYSESDWKHDKSQSFCGLIWKIDNDNLEQAKELCVDLNYLIQDNNASNDIKVYIADDDDYSVKYITEDYEFVIKEPSPSDDKPWYVVWTYDCSAKQSGINDKLSNFYYDYVSTKINIADNRPNIVYHKYTSSCPPDCHHNHIIKFENKEEAEQYYENLKSAMRHMHLDEVPQYCRLHMVYYDPSESDIIIGESFIIEIDAPRNKTLQTLVENFINDK